MSCPKCGETLQDYSEAEGGWCPVCEEWWPPDIVHDYEEDDDEEEEEDEP